MTRYLKTLTSGLAPWQVVTVIACAFTLSLVGAVLLAGLFRKGRSPAGHACSEKIS